ncbi:MAG: hypothetical protein LBO67_03405 [Spirochaetaceae bacterium]|nr:hypothetical protein [Spirochaetaceae bacterium]
MPEAVSTGYQRQNTNIFCLQTGLDTTAPFDNGSGTISIPAGGVVEINGVLFKLNSTISLSKPSNNTAYWVAITDNGNGTASASLVTRPGIYDFGKLGCYTAENKRTLNWVSRGTLSGSPGAQVFSKTTKGIQEVSLQRGWYYAELRSGLGAGDGGANAGASGGSGGVPSVYDTKYRIFFHEGKVLLTAKVGGNGYNGGAGGNGGGYNRKGTGGFGGGSGAGEESELRGIIKTNRIREGNSSGGQTGFISGYGQGGQGRSGLANGGNGGYGGSGSYGSIGETGERNDNAAGEGFGDTGGSGGTGGRSYKGSNGADGVVGGKGVYSNTGGGGGGGGGGGAPGWQRPDGDSAAGYCTISKL